LSDFIKSSVGSTSPTLNKIGNLSFTFPFTTISQGSVPEQGSKVKHLLQTFSHIFAKDDADFGRTSIIKHEIEVQNARPVKEPPRRVPYHLQGELALYLPVPRT
jgi:hypothetical protein